VKTVFSVNPGGTVSACACGTTARAMTTAVNAARRNLGAGDQASCTAAAAARYLIDAID
jgi:hypothetical protein